MRVRVKKRVREFEREVFILNLMGIVLRFCQEEKDQLKTNQQTLDYELQLGDINSTPPLSSLHLFPLPLYNQPWAQTLSLLQGLQKKSADSGTPVFH